MIVPKPRANREAVAEVYADLADLIGKAAWRFCKAYRQDYQECLAEANLAFLHAFHTHDPSKGSLEARLQYAIWARLMDAFRRESRYRARHHAGDGHQVQRCDDQVYDFGTDGVLEGRDIYTNNDAVSVAGVEDPPHFDAEACHRCRDDDGQTLLDLTLDPPEELLTALRALPRPSAATERRCLSRYLRQQGWGAHRVRAAFRAAGGFVTTALA